MIAIFYLRGFESVKYFRASTYIWSSLRGISTVEAIISGNYLSFSSMLSLPMGVIKWFMNRDEGSQQGAR